MIFDTLIELNFLNNYNFLIKKKKKKLNAKTFKNYYQKSHFAGKKRHNF